MKKLLGLLFIFSILSACQDDDDSAGDTIVVFPPKSVIQFTPAETAWFLREAPDSVTIRISGGTAPYVITERPAFSSKVKIVGSNLIIYPNDLTFGPTFDHGNDFVNIRDNNGNENTFNINVEYQFYTYQIKNFQYDVDGDTSISGDLILYNAYWDAFANTMGLSLGNDSNNFNLTLFDVNGTGTHKIPRGYFYYTISTNNFRNNIFLTEADDIQAVEITTMNKRKIKGNFDILTVDQRGAIPGNVRLKCNFAFER